MALLNKLYEKETDNPLKMGLSVFILLYIRKILAKVIQYKYIKPVIYIKDFKKALLSYQQQKIDKSELHDIAIVIENYYK